MALPYRQGGHICSIHSTRVEQLGVAAEYVADGLHCGERCLYVDASTTALDEFRRVLEVEGAAVGEAERRTALLLMTTEQVHLADGAFSSERMLAALNTAVEDALNAGFAGLRTCGDMSWLLGDVEGAEQVVEYEALLNPFFERARALGMCQYDRSRLPPGLLDHAITTHSTVHLDGRHVTNPFYRPPALARHRQACPDDVDWKLRDLARRDS